MLLSSRSWEARKGRGIKGLKEALVTYYFMYKCNEIGNVVEDSFLSQKREKAQRGGRSACVDGIYNSSHDLSMKDSPRRKRRRSFSQV